MDSRIFILLLISGLPFSLISTNYQLIPNVIALQSLITQSTELIQPSQIEDSGTLTNPIVDSDMTWGEAMKNLDSDCPLRIKNNQSLVEVLYYSFDDKVHKGQVIIDFRHANDIQTIFYTALQIKFPIQSVIPIANPKFLKAAKWDDDLSMQNNNSSGFNYRLVFQGKDLSKHASGFAIDINPLQNPYVKKNTIAPPGAKYDITRLGTLSDQHLLVKKFKSLGWAWGGDWKITKDYQHFEKVLDEIPLNNVPKRVPWNY
jgi:hypothetical protein